MSEYEDAEVQVEVSEREGMSHTHQHKHHHHHKHHSSSNFITDKLVGSFFLSFIGKIGILGTIGVVFYSLLKRTFSCQEQVFKYGTILLGGYCFFAFCDLLSNYNKRHKLFTYLRLAFYVVLGAVMAFCYHRFAQPL